MLSPAIICLYCCPLLHFHLQPLSHSYLDTGSLSHQMYTRDWDSSNYGQPNCTTHHIKTCIGNEYGDFYEYEWIYIGEVKEGTDDTPHGIGIRVSNIGYTQQLYNNDS